MARLEPYVLYDNFDRFIEGFHTKNIRIGKETGSVHPSLSFVDRIQRSFFPSDRQGVRRKNRNFPTDLSLLKSFTAALSHKELQEDFSLRELSQWEKKLPSVIEKTFDQLSFPKIKNSRQKEEWNRRISLLKREIWAIRYRLAKLGRGGVQKETPTEGLISSLAAKASDWKKKKALFLGETSLNATERRQMEKLCRYRGLAEEVLKNDRIAEAMFESVLLYHCPVSLVVEFPLVIDKMRRGKMLSHATKGRGPTVRLQRGAGTNRKVDIHVSGEWHPLVWNRAIHFKREGGWATPKEIFRDFRNNHPNGKANFCFFRKSGYEAWDCFHLAKVDLDTGRRIPLSVEKKNWIDDIPVYEELTFDEVLQRYGPSVREGSHLFAMRASGQVSQLDPEGWHGYFDLVIHRKNQEGKEVYRVYPIGSYAKVWPNQKKVLSLLSFLGKTVEGTLCFPDENDQYGHRIHCYDPWVMSDQAMDIILELVKKSIEMSQKGHFNFQFAAQNCIFVPQNLLLLTRKKLIEQGVATEKTIDQHLGRKEIPNMSMNILHAEPTNPGLKKIIRICTYFRHEMIRIFLVRFFLSLFGMWRKRKIELVDEKNRKIWVKVSSFRTNPNLWTQGTIYMPSKLLVFHRKGDPDFARVVVHFGFSGHPLQTP